METLLGVQRGQASLAVGDPSAVAAARRAANDMAREHGLDETTAGRAALVVMEAGTNILKHAERGEILLRPVGSGDCRGLEVIAIDGGPGMQDLAGSMQDGTSTAGSYGVGLGAMQRVADEIDVFTHPGLGTAVWMEVWNRRPAEADGWDLGVVCQPLPGETACGDGWALASDADRAVVMLADGLGHGPVAAVAADTAAEAFVREPGLPTATLMDDLHAALRSTRGAAVAIARVGDDAQVRFAGVGNIAACVIDGPQRRQLISYNGIVGSNMRKVQEVAAPWPADATLLLHSDGLGSRWTLDAYPGLAARHPALIAAVLYRDFARRRDDVTVLALSRRRGRRA